MLIISMEVTHEYVYMRFYVVQGKHIDKIVTIIRELKTREYIVKRAKDSFTEFCGILHVYTYFKICSQIFLF